MRFPPKGLPIRGDSAAKPTAPGAPYGPLGAPVGRPVGFGVHFRIALAGRALRIHAPFPELASRDERFQLKPHGGGHRGQQGPGRLRPTMNCAESAQCAVRHNLSSPRSLRRVACPMAWQLGIAVMRAGTIHEPACGLRQLLVCAPLALTLTAVRWHRQSASSCFECAFCILSL